MLSDQYIGDVNEAVGRMAGLVFDITRQNEAEEEVKRIVVAQQNAIIDNLEELYPGPLDMWKVEIYVIRVLKWLLEELEPCAAPPSNTPDTSKNSTQPSLKRRPPPWSKETNVGCN